MMRIRCILTLMLLAIAFSSAWAGNAWLAEGWPVVHHDGSNSDTSPAPGFEGFLLDFQGLPQWLTLAVPAAAKGRVYLTGATSESACHLAAIDAATGELSWCSDAVNFMAMGSTPVVDVFGNLYIADDAFMVALAKDGEELWRTPVNGLPISAQLTGDGNLLFCTHIGNVMVLDRKSGRELASYELIPDATYDPRDGSAIDCAQGLASEGCYSPNTPAVDDRTGRVFITLNRPDATQGSLVALRYKAGVRPRLDWLWETPDLEGGGAGSPTISADGSRVYTTDLAEHLLAFDASTGELLWKHWIGYSAGGSPSVSADGVIVPAGGSDENAHVIAVRDMGRRGKTIWEHTELDNKGMAVQPAGGVVYTAVVDHAIVNLAVLDLETGKILDMVSTRRGLEASLGSAIGPDGRVYLSTPINGVFAFSPRWSLRSSY
jgi:outer membrane protein assembly factor BamB